MDELHGCACGCGCGMLFAVVGVPLCYNHGDRLLVQSLVFVWL